MGIARGYALRLVMVVVKGLVKVAKEVVKMDVKLPVVMVVDKDAKMDVEVHVVTRVSLDVEMHVMEYVAIHV